MTVNNEITLTGAAARKLGRLSSLFPDSDIAITAEASDEHEGRTIYHISFMDEYGLKPIRRVVIHDTGWSNPSLRNADHERRAAAARAGVTGNEDADDAGNDT